MYMCNIYLLHYPYIKNVCECVCFVITHYNKPRYDNIDNCFEREARFIYVIKAKFLFHSYSFSKTLKID